jgi:geranylgeranyl pyrophosphate synthase
MISDWMDTRGAFERCEAAAESYVLRAKSALASLPETHARKVLGAVADYVLMRRG